MEEKIKEWLLSDFSQIFFVVFFTLLINYIAQSIISKIKNIFAKKYKKHDIKNILIDSAAKPLNYFVLVWGFYFILGIIGSISEIALFSMVMPVKNVLIIMIITWFVIGVISKIEVKWLDEKECSIDITTANALIKLLRIAVYITSALIVMDFMGVNINGLLAFAGAGGISIGIASKDLVSNFFGAFMIYLDKPFSVGDWIRSPDREIEGTVEEIGWRMTKIRTFDKRPLYVPNSIFTNISIENPSRMSNRRIREEIGVRYCDISSVQKIVADIKNMLKKHKEIDVNQTLIINLLNFAPSSVNIMIYTFTKTTVWADYHEIKQDVMLKIASIIEKNNAQIAFPTTTIDLAEGTLFDIASNKKSK